MEPGGLTFAGALERKMRGIDMKRVLVLVGALILVGQSFGEGKPFLDKGYPFPSVARSPNYWCTWNAQGGTKVENFKSGKIKSPDCAHRDNLNEAIVFGKDGWATTLFPEYRRDLFFVLDDGWDVACGIDTKKYGQYCYGSCFPDPERFPSFKGTAGERLRELTRRLKALGWRGAGLWISPQCTGEIEWQKYPVERVKAYWRDRMAEIAEGGIGYLKVDWGAHQHDVWFRQYLTDLKNEMCPDCVIEHAVNHCSWNGCGEVNADQNRRPTPDCPRFIGNPEYEPVREESIGIMRKCDTFRIYDLMGYNASTLDRTAFFLDCAERAGFGTVINVEHFADIGAALGCALGIMPAPNFSKKADWAPTERALKWQRLAPAFRSSPENRTVYSEETLSDFIEPGYEVRGLGRKFRQDAPAAIARGLPLPAVTADEKGEKPYVIAARHPNGCISAAALARHAPDRGFFTPRCDIVLEVEFGERPLAFFGICRTLTVRCPTAGRRVFAQDLASDGPAEDVTDACTFANGRLTLDGRMLARIGYQTFGDVTTPATLVWLKEGGLPVSPFTTEK